eukprot:1280744-Heterocapsa_arctica.AAC.1
MPGQEDLPFVTGKIGAIESPPKGAPGTGLMFHCPYHTPPFKHNLWLRPSPWMRGDEMPALPPDSSRDH